MQAPEAASDSRFTILVTQDTAASPFTVASTLSIRMSSLTTCAPALSMGNPSASPSLIHCAAAGGFFKLLSRS
jgi:hypothetical protein